ncbi:hypothetical protein IFM89_002000 [Coptis chinensis]|uniref:Suppressor of white apricot N-terminal domain-containing protein n=1 Tax=Coptis chinensis TaxID=261450 RepID=A0A835LM30_9MAGN|nr:hypothetical protein IFM89_002000 [Coptis chinensis]
MWHEARRSEKKVHDLMDAARKRAQRRAVFLAKRRGDPQQSLMPVGTRCRMYRDDGIYQATQDQQGLIPWNGKQDILIDRFDGRALLDFIRDSTSRNFRLHSKTEEEEELEEFVNFERYRDLIKLRRRGFMDEEGLQHASLEIEAKITAPFALNRAQPVQPPKKLSRKERRKASQIERDRDRETARVTGTRILRQDPYRESRRSPSYEAYFRSRRSRSRSRSRSYSPSYLRRHDRGGHSDGHRSKSRAPKIEYITEFGGSADVNDQKLAGVSPPPSPPTQADVLNRPSTGRILEALHNDPASAVSLDQEKNSKLLKPSVSGSTPSGLAKLSKPTAIVGSSKLQQGEKKETPQERLKRIMSKQLNKQIKKDTAVEMAKKREQERQRQEKLAEMSKASRHRYRSHSRSRSRSPPRVTEYCMSVFCVPTILFLLTWKHSFVVVATVNVNYCITAFTVNHFV